MELEQQLKTQIIEELKLEDLTPEEIKDEEPLFGEGLGLDSLDAVELVVLLKKHYQLEISEMEEARKAFESVKSLADYVRAHSEQARAKKGLS